MGSDTIYDYAGVDVINGGGGDFIFSKDGVPDDVLSNYASAEYDKDEQGRALDRI